MIINPNTPATEIFAELVDILTHYQLLQLKELLNEKITTQGFQIYEKTDNQPKS